MLSIPWSDNGRGRIMVCQSVELTQWLDDKFPRATTDVGAGLDSDHPSWIVGERHAITVDEEYFLLFVRSEFGFKSIGSIDMPCRFGFEKRFDTLMRKREGK